ncbi:MAG: hypothetical protein ISS82_03325 [Nanoarchaeota archaeon]|nr:hypothetical protein [Nanoarchaeota archaeon]
MNEIKIIPGKHKCGRKMDMRITDVKDDNKNIVAWIIYGICKKCNIVLISDLFLESEKPVQDRDFIIDYDKVSKKGTI